ncbi:Z-ring formation inhibitor MciZ [Paenibacillus rhizovicinus]|uniref:Z-ring formation inhibitor MciZ n=1 Tax=Paenibacillus rhizovicinus TaxID=2704463 RepID=A0A6C0NVM2_9BACL|nr:Z-ring formation inhibitor MciZ [Paenibacillus rhizovicinus]QHW30254.1 Z-ring formation inhibitor MciZ [Paenibacillus rhizovicinus]
MKQYIVNSRLTLVGKAWEIRHQLKLLSKTGSKTALALPAPTLGEFLKNSRSR